MSCRVVNRCGCGSPLSGGRLSLRLEFPIIRSQRRLCARNISRAFKYLADVDGPGIEVALGFRRCEAVINNLRAVFGPLTPLHYPVML